MHRIAAFLLALLLACISVGALAAASSDFPCDFVRVARRHQQARCSPVEPQLLASVTRP